MRRPDYLPLCSIAGWDPTCGAGAGADLRVFSAHGAHGAAVVTALTAQSPSGVQAVEAVPADLLRAQIEAVRKASAPSAWKVGLLADSDAVTALADALDADAALVWDPVLSITAGGWTLPEAAVVRLRDQLLPRAALVTPNRDEALRLAGMPAGGDASDAAQTLLEAGARAVLVTGGDDAPARDLLFRRAAAVQPFELPHVAGGPFHGTGCALSSAIAVRLAQGQDLTASITQAKQYVHALLALAAQTQAWLLPHLAVRPS